MKKCILILTLLHVTLLTSAQTLASNQISFYALYERIDFYDGEGSKMISIAPKFYRHKIEKKWVKPIKVNDQTYFIKKEKFGMESVYTDTGEHIVDMERNGANIRLFKDNSTYTLRPILKLANYNILECYDAEGTLVFKISRNKDKRLSYDYSDTQNPNLILMSLCAHQYQELLLGDRGRFTGIF